MPRNAAWIFAVIVLVLSGGELEGAPLSNDALKAITDTADRICGTVAAAGESQSVKVTGDVKAELGGLAKRLAELGISGTGDLATDS